MKPSTRYAGLLAFAFTANVYSQSGGDAPAQLPMEFAEGERWEWRVTFTPGASAGLTWSRTVITTSDGLRFQDHRGKADSFKTVFETNTFFNTKSLTAWRVWPLEVGKSWSYEGEFYPRIGTASLKQTAKVVAFEEVTVPAGTFKAYKIEYTGWAAAAGPNWRRVDTHWYAPSVKADVKSTIDTPRDQGVMELMSYTPAHTTGASK